MGDNFPSVNLGNHFNFAEELKKFKPILNVEDVEDNIQGSGLKDVMDLLQMANKKNTNVQ